jgi:hypothetical protein
MQSVSVRGGPHVGSVPPALRPLARAYLFGYASAVAPRLLTVIAQYVTRRRRNSEKLLAVDDRDEVSLLDSILYILKSGFDPQRFPTFCAVLVGGSTLLQVCIPYCISVYTISLRGMFVRR